MTYRCVFKSSFADDERHLSLEANDVVQAVKGLGEQLERENETLTLLIAVVPESRFKG